MASIDDVAQELVGILLAAGAEMVGEDPQAALQLNGGVKRKIEAEGTDNPLLKNAEGAVAVRIAERRVLGTEAEISQGRGISEALEDAIEVACIPQIL